MVNNGKIAFFVAEKAVFFKKIEKNACQLRKRLYFCTRIRKRMMSSGVMAALQILVLPVKVRILARQLKVEEKTCYFE